jgi:hypothetical protein
MKADGRGLLETFRGLAPAREPIAIQRWSIRRVLLIIATVLLSFLAVLTGIALFLPSRGDVGYAMCGTGRTMQLMAQAVPTATKLPCIGDLPLGWSTEQATVVRGSATFTVGIGSDLANPVTVTLTADCPVGRTDQGFRAISIDGACVGYHVAPGTEAGSVPSFDGGGLSFMDRSELIASVEHTEGLVLCGALAPACPSGPGS